MTTDLPYRPCVGIMLLNQDNKVFVAKRIDTMVEAWQMPQGGIDEGEDPVTAAFREMEEEVGSCHAEILDECEDWIKYDLPDHLIGKVWKGKYRGQKMKWFVLRYLGTDGDINIATEHPEFSEWRWIEMAALPETIVAFKKSLYQKLVDRFGKWA